MDDVIDIRYARIGMHKPSRKNLNVLVNENFCFDPASALKGFSSAGTMVICIVWNFVSNLSLKKYGRSSGQRAALTVENTKMFMVKTGKTTPAEYC